MDKRPDVSLVLACYNEGKTLKQSLEKIWEHLSGSRFTSEVICIDDASRDTTLETIENFAKHKKNWTVYSHTQNKGRGGTVKEGILKSKGKVVGYIDVDLEVSAAYINDFVRSIDKGADLAIATRVYKVAPSSLIRAASSILYTMLSRRILGHSFQDTEAGYKFFNRKRIIPILKKTKSDHWFFDTEIILRSVKKGLKVSEISVLFLRRTDKVSTVRLIPDTWDYLKSLWRFRKELKL